MLILEAQLLQDVIAECIRDHVFAIDISHLIPDIVKIADTISEELRESSRTFMKHYEWTCPSWADEPDNTGEAPRFR